jgi:hypothetical protein
MRGDFTFVYERHLLHFLLSTGSTLGFCQWPLRIHRYELGVPLDWRVPHLPVHFCWEVDNTRSDWLILPGVGGHVFT